MSERLFFALWPDALVRGGLNALQSELPCHHRIKTTHAEDMHVTLAFLGDVDAERRACVEAVADRIETPAFDFIIDRVGFWGRPCILWCGPTQTPDPLQTLVRGLRNGLEDCGFEPKRRPYSAHITLARKAQSVPFKAMDQPLRWPVRDFVLVASRLGGAPPHYQVLRRWVLA